MIGFLYVMIGRRSDKDNRFFLFLHDYTPHSIEIGICFDQNKMHNGTGITKVVHYLLLAPSFTPSRASD